MENDIVDVIVFLSDCGQNMDRSAIRDLVKSFLDDMKWEVKCFRDNKPGLDWCSPFEERHKHKISRRKRQGLSYARASGLTDENVQKFYKLWQDVVKENNVRQENIWNCDESGFQPNPKGGLVYINNQNRQAYELAYDNSKETYTVMFTCSPSGKYLPPFICYKAKLLYKNWMIGGPEGAYYGFTHSGWMEEIAYYNYLTKIFIPHSAPANPAHHRILLFDGYGGHLSYRVAKKAMDNNIHLVCLPPHTSHALQPLDVGCFKSAKSMWYTICSERGRSRDGRRRMGKDYFPEMLGAVHNHMVANPDLSVNGWKSTGLWPFNTKAVDDKIIGRHNCVRVIPQHKIPNL